MKRKFFKTLAILLCFSMIAPQFTAFAPLEIHAEEETETGVYEPDYSEDGAMNWYHEVLNDGNPGAEGAPEYKDGAVVKENFKGYLIDNNSPATTNGSFEFTMNISSQISVGIMFHTEDTMNYSRVGLDSGGTIWAQKFINGAQSDGYVTFTQKHNKDFYGKDVNVKLDVTESKVTLSLDGQVFESATVQNDVKAGRFGICFWGNQFDPQTLKIKNVKITYEKANYSAVDAAKAKVPADLSVYTDETVEEVTDALAAVVENLDITKQSEVDAMAEAIEDAVAKLELKPEPQTSVYEPDYSQQGAMSWDVKAESSASSDTHPGNTNLVATAEGDVSAEGFKGYAVDLNSPEIKNGEIEFTMKMSETASFAVLYRATDVNNHQYVAIDTGGKIYITDSVAGKETYTTINKSVAMGTNTDIKVKLTFQGKTLKLYIDDVEILNKETAETTNKKGHFGFRFWAYKNPAPNIEIKNVKITEYADYSAVDAAKAKVPADLSVYTDETVDAVTVALAAVVENLDITKQSEVDAMAKAIEDAVAKLELKPEPQTPVYEPDYSKDGAMDWYCVDLDGNALAQPEYKDGAVVKENFKGYLFDKNSPAITNGSFEFTMNISNPISVGIMFHTEDWKNYSRVGLDSSGTIWAQKFINGNQSDGYITFTKKHNKDFYGKDVNVKLDVTEGKVTLSLDGQVFESATVQNDVKAGRFGIGFWGNQFDPQTLKIKNVKITEYADYSAVNAAKATVPADLSKYTKETAKAVTDALAAVVENLDITKQSEVNAMAKAIEDAVAALVLSSEPVEPVVYTPDYSSGTMNWVVKKDSGVTSDLKATEKGGITAPKFKGWAYDQNSPILTNSTIEFDVNMTEKASFGVIYRAVDMNNLSYIAIDYNPTDGKSKVLLSDVVNGKESYQYITAVEGLECEKDIKLKVKILDGTVTLYQGNKKVASGTTSRIVAGKYGFRVWEGRNNPFPDITLENITVKEIFPIVLEEDTLQTIEIKSNEMTVQMDNRFPSPYEYTIGNQKIDGQKTQLRTVELNGTEYYVGSVSVAESTADSITYNVTVTDVTTEVEEYPEDIAKENVISSLKVKFTVSGKTLRMDVLEIKDAEGFVTRKIAFPGQAFASFSDKDRAKARVLLLGNGLRESDFTLSQYPNGGQVAAYAVIYDGRFAATMESNIIETTQKLTVQNKTEGSDSRMSLINGSWIYRAPGNEEYWGEEELPWAVVAFTEDCNDDGTANWQDGAVAYRSIGVKPYGWEEIRNHVSHIFTNCPCGQSQPFMRQLDTIKTMYNYYDGFGQMILEKGYNGEGHDDAYYDLVGHINERAGGEEDFKYLLKEAKNYNAKVGAHINVIEYTIDSFGLGEENYLYKDANGNPNQKGWHWFDQAFKNNVDQEILDGVMDKRLQEFVDTYDDLEWIYIDVYSGIDWYADKLTAILNKNELPVGTEYRGAMEKDMVWVHNSNDIHYPVSSPQDTQMYRMMKNSWADIFPPHELLKNVQLPSVGAWEGYTDFNEGVSAFYNNNLAVKYMQHQDIVKMTDTEVVFDKGLVIKKEYTTLGGLNRDRVNMYQDGKLIASLPIGKYRPNDRKEDAVAQSDPDTYLRSKVFIPWYNEDSTTKNPLDADKIYCWDAFGGTTTWELPSGWSNLSAVKVYKLTNNGREYVEDLAVTGGKVTVKAEKEVPYIILKAEAKEDTLSSKANNWGENTLVSEPGFDSMNFENWTVDGSGAQNVKNSRGDCVALVKASDTSISQKITVEPGKNYTFSVWTDVRGDVKSILSLEVGDRVLSNYTQDTSTYKKLECNQKYTNTSYQQISINVTIPEGVDSVTLTLKTEGVANGGSVYFDDVRVFESYRQAAVSGYTLYQDFENVPEAYGPFVCAVKGDKQIHLSEKNPDESNPQLKHYVLDGRFSLKMNNSRGSYTGALIRTLPVTLRLKANTKYEMGLDYFTETSQTYTFRAKDSSGNVIQGAEVILTPVTTGTSENVRVEFTTPNDENCFIEVYQLKKISDIEKEYLAIDNFYVNELSDDNEVAALYEAYTDAKNIKNDGYSESKWNAFTTSLAYAETVLRTNGTVADYASAEEANKLLADAISALTTPEEDENTGGGNGGTGNKPSKDNTSESDKKPSKDNTSESDKKPSKDDTAEYVGRYDAVQSQGQNAKTGDSANIILWAIVLVAAAGIVLVIRKKQTK